MLSIVDRKRFEVAGLMPVEIDGKIAGIHKTMSSLRDLARAYRYCTALYNNILALHDSFTVLPIAELHYDSDEIWPINLSQLSGGSWEREHNLSGLIETIINGTGYTTRIIDMSNVTCIFEGVGYGAGYGPELELKPDSWDKFGILSYLFYGCKTIRCIDMSKISAKVICNMECTFAGCESLKYLDLSTLDTSELKYASGIFDGCRSLETLDMSNWSTLNLRESEAKAMFRGCNSLKRVVINNVDNPVIMNELSKLGHVEIVEPT